MLNKGKIIETIEIEEIIDIHQQYPGLYILTLKERTFQQLPR
jgi:hypothetical protein